MKIDETKKEFIKKAKGALLADKKYSDIDVDRASELIYKWMIKHRTEIDAKSFDEIINKCKKEKELNRRANEEFQKLLIIDKKLFGNITD